MRPQIQGCSGGQALRVFRSFIVSILISVTPALGWPEELRPWAEYETAGLLAMSFVAGFDSLEAKITLMENLPPGVKAFIYTQYYADDIPAQMRFGRFVAEGRAEIFQFNIIGDSTWTRDVMPLPLVRKNNPHQLAALVGAVHAVYFEPDQILAEKFQVPLREHDFEFEGGNFLASATGDCLIVQGIGERDMSDEFFADYYKCSRVIRFPHLKDIGHIDERVKVVGDQFALTDDLSYKQILEDHGYTVLMVPARNEPYQNYLNSVLLNGVAFVPTFDDPDKDQLALEIYKLTGQFHRIVPIPSKQIVDQGTGGIHCLTATFPAIP